MLWHATWWIQSTRSSECKRTVHLHLKNSLCTHWETCCYLEQPLCLSVIPPPPSLSLWPGVNLSFLLPADSCAWLSGSLFMRSLHLSPAAASVTPLPSPPFFLPSLPLSKWKQIIYGGVSSAHCYLSGTSGLHLAQGKHWSTHTHTRDLSVTTQTLLKRTLPPSVQGLNVFLTLHDSSICINTL